MHPAHPTPHLAECAQLSNAEPATNVAWGLVGWALGALGNILQRVLKQAGAAGMYTIYCSLWQSGQANMTVAHMCTGSASRHNSSPTM
jgi:hypothetical protein